MMSGKDNSGDLAANEMDSVTVPKWFLGSGLQDKGVIVSDSNRENIILYMIQLLCGNCWLSGLSWVDRVCIEAWVSVRPVVMRFWVGSRRISDAKGYIYPL